MKHHVSDGGDKAPPWGGPKSDGGHTAPAWEVPSLVGETHLSIT